MLKASSTAEAFEMANKLIDGDYMQDARRTERAGYDIYSATSGEYICDLGDRLEVNKNDGRSINIWIEKNRDTTFDFGENTMKTNIEEEIITLSQDEAIAVSKVQQPIVHEHVERYTFAISKSYGTIPEEIELYNALGQESFWATSAASDFVAEWCKQNNVPWGSIRIDPGSIEHHEHGTPEHGHYCFDAYVKLREAEDEIQL